MCGRGSLMSGGVVPVWREWSHELGCIPVWREVSYVQEEGPCVFGRSDPVCGGVVP